MNKISELMKKHGVWDGKHKWDVPLIKGNPHPYNCEICDVNYLRWDRLDPEARLQFLGINACPGPEEWGLEELFRLYLKLYWYIGLEKRTDGSFFLETVDPDIIMSMSNINKGKVFYADHDYVDPIVDLRRTLEAAILGKNR